MLWLLSLALVALNDGQSTQPLIIVLTVALVSVWTALTLWISFRRAVVFRSWSFLALDIAVSSVVLVAPTVAGSPNFVGGYPLSSVLIGVLGKGLAGAVAPVLVLVGIVLLQIGMGDRVGDLTVLSSNVLVYPFIAAPVAWAVGAVRRTDRLRVEAEQLLDQERADRIRAEERSEMAAHLHDSVLQTLALIQRNSSEADTVTSLARAQERDLRGWLFGSMSEDESFDSVLVAMGAEIEGLYKVPVDVVTVGNATLTDSLRAVLNAGREAMVNAAKHSGAPVVSVYAEVAHGTASIFVRDRGQGFDLEGVPADRRGISESIVARMNRNGGAAVIRSNSGVGTEVQLTMDI